jgi:glycosyltransferase involved in cell wall biosynthesis
MHICHISTTFIHKAGSSRRTFFVLNELINHGYRVSLIVGRDYQPSEDWDMERIEIIRIPHLVKYIHPVKDILALLKITSALKRLSPDAVHTHLAKAGVIGRIAARVARRPSIFHTVHGPSFPESGNFLKRAIFKFLEKWCSRYTQFFVFVGEAIKAEYIRNNISTEKNSVVIRSGRLDCEIDRFAQTGASNTDTIRKESGIGLDHFVMVSVGRLVPSKQIEHSIRILKRLKNRGTRLCLWIVGDALLSEEKKYKDSLRKLVLKLGLEKDVIFWGYRQDVLDIIQASDILVLTSKYEGLPNVLVEAGIVGTPAVSYNVSGADEVILNRQTGFIVPANDEESLYTALVEILDSKDGMISIGKLAQYRVSSVYRMSFMLKEKMRFYSSALPLHGKIG